MHPMKKPAKNTRKTTKTKNKILEKRNTKIKILEKRNTTAKKNKRKDKSKKN